MSLVLQSSGGGSVTVQEPVTASNFTQTLPAATGEIVVTGANSSIVSGTAVASTSGTAIDFTSIPSWVKRITVMFNGLSTNGTSIPIIQIGDAGGIETTGYAGSVGYIQNALNSQTTALSTGFALTQANAASTVYNGYITINLLGSNQWVFGGSWGLSNTPIPIFGGGAKTLSDTLDRVRITTVNGTDAFDAGLINILYE